MTGTLRVATLNLWGQRGDWAARRRVLAAGFARLNADLVAFQEAIVTDGADQVREILGGDYHVVHQREREGDGQGVSIGGRLPVHGRILARCGEHGGPTLAVSSCERIFDRPADGVWASDHFGLTADLTVP
jgi:endonuclease/exonuclease/phosphatase family metal-dependent hydrolase